MNDALNNPPHAEGQVGDSSIIVYVGIDPKNKDAVGDADPDEELPRLPYRVNRYLLFLGEPPNLPEENYIPVAELNVSGGEVSISNDYYPPCVTISASEHLMQKAGDFRNRLENLLSLASRAFMAMASDTSLSGEKTNLQTAYREMMSLFVYNLASMLDDFAAGRRTMHPLKLIINIKKLFRVLSSLLNMQPGLKDYLNERYFSKERKSEIGRFLALMDGFLLSEYNHLDIRSQIKVIDEIFEELRGLMGFLAQTKRDQLGDQAVATDTLTYRSRTYRLAEYGSYKVENIGGLNYVMIEISKALPISDTVILMSKDLFGDAGWASMQVRLGLNDARGLGETDPVDIDTTSYANKVALHPQDMLQSQSVRRVTLIFRGAGETDKFSSLGKTDLIIYTL
ncbi:MAG TPA: hypothetical protein ENL22_00940 [candidate division Zixibacteria bacterium]|nr:hypothetical protein [candidate division Zixibacteria bacterium]